MPTYIVERTQLPVFPQNHDEREAGKIVSTIVTWFNEPRGMGHEKPGLDSFSQVSLSFEGFSSSHALLKMARRSSSNMFSSVQ